MSPAEPDSFIHVVAAAVIDGAGRILIAQRPPGKHLAGGWEFPGGKLEAGEDRRIGLARELREEIGIVIRTPRPLIRLRHAYTDVQVLLDIWVVRQFSGEPNGLDGQALRWCTHRELESVDLLPADKPIVAALRLPERLEQASTAFYAVKPFTELNSSATRPNVLTEAQLQGVYCADVKEGATAALAGADFLVLRATLSARELSALCALVEVPVFAHGFTLVDAWQLGASGVSDLAQSK